MGKSYLSDDCKEYTTKLADSILNANSKRYQKYSNGKSSLRSSLTSNERKEARVEARSRIVNKLQKYIDKGRLDKFRNTLNFIIKNDNTIFNGRRLKELSEPLLENNIDLNNECYKLLIKLDSKRATKHIHDIDGKGLTRLDHAINNGTTFDIDFFCKKGTEISKKNSKPLFKLVCKASSKKYYTPNHNKKRLSLIYLYSAFKQAIADAPTCWFFRHDNKRNSLFKKVVGLYQQKAFTLGDNDYAHNNSIQILKEIIKDIADNRHIKTKYKAEAIIEDFNNQQYASTESNVGTTINSGLFTTAYPSLGSSSSSSSSQIRGPLGTLTRHWGKSIISTTSSSNSLSYSS